MITVYSITVDSQYISDSIAHLSGSNSYLLWQSYISQLFKELASQGDASKLWPSGDKYSPLSTLLMYAARMWSQPLSRGISLDHNIASLSEIAMVSLKECAMLPDEGLSFRAWCAANREGDHYKAEETWNKYISSNDLKISHSFVYQSGTL